MLLMIVTPKHGTIADKMIDAGSGVVIKKLGTSNHVLAYYEGNRLGAENLNDWETRVIVAAGRLAQNYPTIAKAGFDFSDFDVVGTIETETWTVTLSDLAKRDAYLNRDEA